MSDEDEDARAEAHWRATVSARWAEFRKKWLAEHRTAPIAEIAKLAGLASHDAANVLRGWEEAGRVFAVREGDQRLYPLFQFGPDGQPKPEFRPLLEAVRGGLDSWKLASWLTGPSAEFRDWKTPLEVIETDPQAVVAAAERHLGEPIF